MAGFSILIQKQDVASPYPFIPSTGLTVTLRINPYSGTTYTLAEVGVTAPGVYNHSSIDDGMYKLYIGGVEQTQYKTFHIVDSSPRFDTISEWTTGAGVYIDGIKLIDNLNASSIMALTGAQTAAGIKTFSSAPKSSAAATLTTQLMRWDETCRLTDAQTVAGLKTFSTIPKASAAATQTTELIRWDEAMRLADTQTVTGIKTFSGACNFSDDQVYFTHLTVAPRVSSQPDNDASVCRKEWIEALVAGVAVTPFQESSNKVRVIPDGTVQSGKVYTTITSAIASFTSPLITNQCFVEIVGTGGTIQYIIATLSSFVNYVHLIGAGRHLGLILAGTASNTKTMNIENCTAFIGANDIATARTFNSFTFRNCVINAYKSTTFTNCKIENCIIYHKSGETPTIAGTTVVVNSAFSQVVTVSGSDTVAAGMIDGFDTASAGMPTDPSSAPS